VSFDMNQLLQQVGEMQQQMQAAQADLAKETVEATAGGGMVTVTASGAGEIKSISIDPKAVDPEDTDLLGDMVLAAVNEALKSANSLAESKLGGLAGGLGGLGLPGL
jgi:DNA-binding YbaB/EbfC family protein